MCSSILLYKKPSEKTTAEALSCGTPVIAYKGTATLELIGTDDKCGYLIDNMDANKFADKIMAIFEYGSSHYSANCRERAESMFNIETNLSEYIDLFKRMCTAKSR